MTANSSSTNEGSVIPLDNGYNIALSFARNGLNQAVGVVYNLWNSIDEANFIEKLIITKEIVCSNDVQKSANHLTYLGENTEFSATFKNNSTCGYKSPSVFAEELRKAPVPDQYMKNLQQGINQIMRDAAHKMAKTSIIMSALILMATTIKLGQIWKEISEAKNITKNSKQTIAKLKIDMHALDVAMSNLEKDLKELVDMDGPKWNRFTRTHCKLKNQHLQVTFDIKKLSFEINGKIVSLERSKVDSLVNSATGVAQIVANIFLHLGNFDLLTTSTRLSLFGVTAALGTVSLGSVACVFLAENRIIELKKIMDEINVSEIFMKEMDTVLNKCDQLLEELEQE